jgi:hypothetical protein
VSNLLFFRRSCAYRSAATELMRKARDMPLGPERRAARQLARAFLDLAKTEAWLEGKRFARVGALGAKLPTSCRGKELTGPI